MFFSQLPHSSEISVHFESNDVPGSFILAGLIEAAALPYFGIQIGELSLDQKAEILFVDQG